MASVVCPSCGAVSEGPARTCASCGTPLGRQSLSGLKSAGARRPAAREPAVDSTMQDETMFDDGSEPSESSVPSGAKVARAPTRSSSPNVRPSSPQRQSQPTATAPNPVHHPPPAGGRQDPLIGQKLSEYLIQERIGVGGMGIVYKAVHPMIGKEVAVKVLRPDVVTDPRDMERLLEEARVVNSIKHRGIINIFSAGTLPDGRHYLVMELLEGESLEQRMARDGTVGVGDAVIILEEVLSALAAAHNAGIVHRDLKPANVFLVQDGSGKMYVKLLDFGLARRQQQNVTRIAGTPDYISPEHARGRAAGPKADLYSFGVLCFHMLTGQLPFTGTTPMEVMEKHVHMEPPDPRELAPDIPKALGELILRLLAKEPEDRPSAAEVKNDLRAATKHLRLSATMMSMMYAEPVKEKGGRDKHGEKSRAARVEVDTSDGGDTSDGDADDDDDAKDEDDRKATKRQKALDRDAKKAAGVPLKQVLIKRWPIFVGVFVVLWLVGIVAYLAWPAPPPPPEKPLIRPKPAEVARPAPKPVEPVAVPTPAPAPVAAVDAGVAVAPAGDAGAVVAAAVDPELRLEDSKLAELKRAKHIDEDLDAMDVLIKREPERAELFEKAWRRVKRTCDDAVTMKTIAGCEDEVGLLKTRFYKL